MTSVGRAALVVAVMMMAGCTATDGAPAPAPSGGPVADVTLIRGALLQPGDIGQAWAVPSPDPAAPALVSLCGAETTAPPVPGAPTVVASRAVDEGRQGAQTLHQVGLVYADPVAATAALTALRQAADACPPTVSVPQKTGDRQEPAYTESVKTVPLTENGWSGFVLTRHKQYDQKHPATADTAVVVLARRNIVLFDAYAIYRLGGTAPPSANAQFAADWKRLVGTVLNRLG
jgi:hypothetical protein